MSDLIDLLEIETSEISQKYDEILEEINKERKKLEEYYDEKEIKKLEEEYKYYKNSEKKGLCNYALKYEKYIKIKKDYEEYLEKKPLENSDEIKMYINKKIDELRYNLLNKNICEEILLKNKKLKKYEKKYELYIFYEFMIHNFPYQYIDEELEKFQDENNLEIIKNYLEGKYFPIYINNYNNNGNIQFHNLNKLNYIKENGEYYNDSYINYMLRRGEYRRKIFNSILDYLTKVEEGIIIMELDENNLKNVNDEIKKMYLNYNNEYGKLEKWFEYYKTKNNK